MRSPPQQPGSRSLTCYEQVSTTGFAGALVEDPPSSLYHDCGVPRPVLDKGVGADGQSVPSGTLPRRTNVYGLELVQKFPLGPIHRAQNQDDTAFLGATITIQLAHGGEVEHEIFR